MATWKVTSSDGSKTFTVDAADEIPEADVIEFVEAQAPSWVNGGRYAMSVDETAPAQPAPQPAATPNQLADRRVKQLAEQMQKIDDERQKLAYQHFRSPSVLTGGTGKEGEAAPGQRIAELTKQYDELKEQHDALAIGSTGQTVGGILGSLGGGATGVLLGSPLGPPGMAIGGAIGSVLGGAGGVAAGTHLWDIPEALGARDISEDDAAKLIQDRVIQSLIWDGAFVLILGPGGRVIGKMANGSRLAPALKAAVKDSFAWDQLARSKEKQLADVVAKRAARAPAGISTQASDALGIPVTSVSREELNRRMIGDIAAQSGGRVPTTGEVTGLVKGGETFVRTMAPAPFSENDKILAATAEKIRKDTLGVLDQMGAYTGPDLGNKISQVVKSAAATLRRVAGPVFDRAAQQGVFADMTDVLKHVDEVLARDVRSANRLLAPAERNALEVIKDSLTQHPRMPMDGAQDFISGNKAALRGLAGDGTKPGEFMAKVLGDLNEKADEAFILALRTSGDPTLVKDLLQTRKLYRETLQDLYSDTMATVARKTPEDVGRALTGKGTITEIRELRAALDRAVAIAPERARMTGGQAPSRLSEISKRMAVQERSRIDAGLIKGFIEKQTMSLDDLPGKLRDPDFRATLKELLTGPGMADPALGRQILSELDRTLSVVSLIKPEMAPKPGRVPVPGAGSMGLGTIAAAATGSIQSAVPAVLSLVTGMRFIGKAVAHAMTTGNTGVLRQIQRAASLARLAGTNAAAAEAARAAFNELDQWDRTTNEASYGP